MANQGIIIDPTKSNKMIGSPQVSAPSTNDSSMSLGITKAVSNGIMDLGMAFQKLKDFQSKSYGLTTEVSVDDDISNTMLEAQTNKDFYKTNDGINALETKVNEKLATYRKTSLEQGYDMEYVDAFEARIRHKLQMAKNNFLVKNYEYQEKVTLDNYIHSQEMAQQNNERYMALGDYSSALAGTQQVLNNMIGAVDAGIIDRSKLIPGIKGVYKGVFNSFGLSLINKPNAQALLDNYSKMTAGEFFEHFKGFNTKINGEDFMIGADEYEEFKSGINQAQAEYNRRNKVEKEKTKVEEINKQYKMMSEPVEAAYDMLRLKEGDIIPPEAILLATNIKYQKNFKSLSEAIEQGYAPAYLPKVVEEYNKKFESDPSISVTSKIQNKLNNLSTYVGVQDEKIIQNFLDTNNNGIIPASSLTFEVLKGVLDKDENVSRAGKILNNEIQELYNTPEKLAIYKTFEKTKVREDLFKDYDKKMVYDLNVGSDYQKNITHEIIPGAGTTMKDLEFNAMHGDLRAKSAYKDIKKITKHYMLEKLLEQTGGTLNPEVAEKLDIKQKAGMPFEALSETEKQQVLDYYFEKDSFFSGNEFKESTKSVYEKVVKDGYGANIKQVDLGSNGRLILGNDYDVEKTRKAVLERINDKDMVFINSRTGQRIVNHKNIKALSYIGENKIILKYGSENVVDENGRPYVFTPIKMEDKK